MRVEKGEWPQDDNPLKNAPHTAVSLLAGEWKHPYSRELAAYPVPALKHSKYWSPVARVDNVYGDRNLFCSCIPMSEFAEAPTNA
jgi:glycine dehydrogenase